MTASGNGAAMCCTKSSSPDAPAGNAVSTTSTAIRSMSARLARTARGVKRPITTLRTAPCFGGSSSTTISEGGTGGAPSRGRVTPWALEKRNGCAAIWTMSACLVIAQNGRSPAASMRATGASARNRVHTSCG